MAARQRPSREYSEKSTRCTEQTNEGTRCQRRTCHRSGICGQHLKNYSDAEIRRLVRASQHGQGRRGGRRRPREQERARAQQCAALTQKHLQCKRAAKTEGLCTQHYNIQRRQREDMEQVGGGEGVVGEVLGEQGGEDLGVMEVGAEEVVGDVGGEEVVGVGGEGEEEVGGEEWQAWAREVVGFRGRTPRELGFRMYVIREEVEVEEVVEEQGVVELNATQSATLGCIGGGGIELF
ncbi:uncharacterized protein LOC121430169 [Lytechinus variegatus]|uniref:uncharacterized protein LOC121430169 n=1 Tax=Lytechinus variegatus TaxID=7654 RepID=UPI001BB2AB5B|nr:uncharacterized protein LOC121430169 [Lytechinus variegatus]